MDLRYPVGKVEMKSQLSDSERRAMIDVIAETPARMAAAVAGLTPEQLDTPYRPGGWTVRQVVHHVPDSHLNAYTRVKLALTEDTPTIKPYDEARWAELADTQQTPIETSLQLLDCVHKRWVIIFRNMKPAEFARSLNHPEVGPMTLDAVLCMYAWHGRHHVAHITSLRERMGWK